MKKGNREGKGEGEKVTRRNRIHKGSEGKDKLTMKKSTDREKRD